MLEPRIQLIGHICTFGYYPSPVIPVLKDNTNQCYFIVYLESDVPSPSVSKYEIYEEDLKDFTIYDKAVIKSFENFTYNKDKLFAFSEDFVEKYEIKDEKKFFIKLLKDPDFSSANTFFRLSLAKSTEEISVIIPEIIRCGLELKFTQSESLEFLNSWYEDLKVELTPLWRQQCNRDFPDNIIEFFLSEINIPDNQKIKFFKTYTEPITSCREFTNSLLESIPLPRLPKSNFWTNLQWKIIATLIDMFPRSFVGTAAISMAVILSEDFRKNRDAFRNTDRNNESLKSAFGKSVARDISGSCRYNIETQTRSRSTFLDSHY